MADTPESKPPFWSSLPGIFTGLGGLLVAATGLVTALYQTGVVGSKTDSNTVQPANAVVTVATVPATSPTLNAESERYKSLTGRWEVIEEQLPKFGGKKITWEYNAAVAGNVLTLSGKILAIDGNKNLKEGMDSVRSTYVTTLMGSAGVGEFKRTENGVTMSYPATIRLDDEPTKFHGTIDIKGQQACSLTGRKL